MSMLLAAGCVTAPDPRIPPRAPLSDYHQHLVSPAFASIAKLPPFDGQALLQRMDAAGVRQAVVLSTGYSFADERKKLADPDRLTREENDWTSAQVAPTRGRLVGFCGINPLRDGALREIERCLALPGMRGLKLHFGNSGASLRNPAHLARMAEVFALAGRKKAPILVHMRARGGENFGGPDAQILIDKLLPLIPNIDIIIAHFGGAGPGYPDQADEVMGVFAEAVQRRNPGLRRTYFDIATILTTDSTPGDARLIAQRIRQLGAERVLYGSDTLRPDGPTISDSWGYVIGKLGLTTAELRQIANNRLPFMR